MSRRTRTLRYGGSIAIALVGVACGALIPGSAGGTAATVLVGIGLVGVISLLFYEVGLTEDRERAQAAGRGAVGEGGPGDRVQGDGTQGDRGPGDPARRSPREPGSPGEHRGGRPRPLARRRGQRRRLR